MPADSVEMKALSEESFGVPKNSVLLKGADEQRVRGGVFVGMLILFTLNLGFWRARVRDGKLVRYG